jgi:hypothetical protein
MEIIAVCSEIHTKHTNKLCGQNIELSCVKLAVHIVTTGLRRVNIHYTYIQSVPRSKHYLSYKTQSVNAGLVYDLKVDVSVGQYG